MKKLKLHEGAKRKNSLDLNPNPLARNSSIYHE